MAAVTAAMTPVVTTSPWICGDVDRLAFYAWKDAAHLHEKASLYPGSPSFCSDRLPQETIVSLEFSDVIFDDVSMSFMEDALRSDEKVHTMVHFVDIVVAVQLFPPYN